MAYRSTLPRNISAYFDQYIETFTKMGLHQIHPHDDHHDLILDDPTSATTRNNNNRNEDDNDIESNSFENTGIHVLLQTVTTGFTIIMLRVAIWPEYAQAMFVRLVSPSISAALVFCGYYMIKYPLLWLPVVFIILIIFAVFLHSLWDRKYRLQRIREIRRTIRLGKIAPAPDNLTEPVLKNVLI